MMQNNIEKILKENPLIPVVTIDDEAELDAIYQKLKAKNISAIEITLRTEYAWEAIKVFKEKYGNEAYFLSKGAAMDVIGAHSFQLSQNFTNTVHERFPRTNFRNDILETMTSLSHKENTRADILFKMGFQKLASNNKLDLL